jgi:hypothetical protein
MMQDREDGDQQSDLLAGRLDPGLVGPGKNSLPTLALLLAGTIVLGTVGGWFLSSRDSPDAPVVAMLSPEQLADAIPTLNAGRKRPRDPIRGNAGFRSDSSPLPHPAMPRAAR